MAATTTNELYAGYDLATDCVVTYSTPELQLFRGVGAVGLLGAGAVERPVVKAAPVVYPANVKSERRKRVEQRRAKRRK